jgi:hypothetical protein
MENGIGPDNEHNAQQLFNQMVKFLSGAYISAQREMLKGLFKAEKILGEIVEAEGLPSGVSDEVSFSRGAKYIVLYSTGLIGDPNVVAAAIRDSDLKELVDAIEKVCGAKVNNTGNIILPKQSTPTDKVVRDAESVSRASNVIEFKKK